jgi:hypothetical protein
MITEKKLRYLEEQANISTDFAELTTFLEIEKFYPEIETTEDRNRIRNLAKKRVQELSKIKNVK